MRSLFVAFLFFTLNINATLVAFWTASHPISYQRKNASGVVLSMNQSGNAIVSYLLTDEMNSIGFSYFDYTLFSWQELKQYARGGHIPSKLILDDLGNIFHLSYSGFNEALVFLPNELINQRYFRSAEHCPALSANHGGEAISIWFNYDFDRFNPHKEVVSSFYSPFTGWGPEMAVSSYPYFFPNPVSMNFSIVMHKKGTKQAKAAWADPTGTKLEFFGTLDGINWNSESPSLYVAKGLNPQLVTNRSGGIVAIWQAGNNNQGAFFNGSSWSTIVNLPFSNPLFGPLTTAIAMGENKKQAIVVGISKQGKIESVLFDATASPSWSALPITSPPGINVLPDIALDKNGHGLLVWLNRNNNVVRLYSAFYSPKSGWQAPEQKAILKDGSMLSNHCGPKVGIVSHSSSKSNAIILWNDYLSPFTQEKTVFAMENFNIFQPTGPTNFKGMIKRDSNGASPKYFDELSWRPSNDSKTVNYIIRKNNTIIAEIPKEGPYLYYDYSREKKEKTTYTLTAQSLYGVESDPLVLTLPRDL